MRATVSPILLFGVLAPAVSPSAPHPRRATSRCRRLDVLDPGAPEVHGARFRIDPARVLDVIRRHALVAQGGERDRVARVESADHDHRRERLLEQREDGVLPLLRGAADGVEGAEVGGARLLAAAVRWTDPPPRRSRATRAPASSSGSPPDAAQMHVGIEPGDAARANLARNASRSPRPST
jgi:hypothetical protein